MKKTLILVSLFFLWPAASFSLPAFNKMVEKKFKVAGDCNICHVKGGGSPLNVYGQEFLKAGANENALEKIGKPDIGRGDQPLKTEKTEAKEAEIFSFEEPLAESGTATPGLSPPSNLTFGGAFDVRYLAPANREDQLMFHVVELVLTTTLAENVTLLMEQLLQTSPMESAVGDDHGFVYLFFSNPRFLPPGGSFKIGRFRARYGIDAVSDAAVNPLQTPYRKTIGFISDRGVEFAGFLNWLSFNLSIMNGPEIAGNENKPVFFRLSTDNIPQLKLGLSYFNGMSYDYYHGDFQSVAGVYVLAPKERFSFDFKKTFGVLDLSFEYTFGSDRGATFKQPYGYYLRADFPVGPRLEGNLKYDLWRYDKSVTEDERNISYGLTYRLTDSMRMRLVYSDNRSSPWPLLDNVLTTQILVEF